MAERAVRSALIVVDAPGFDLRFRIFDRRELMDVQALVSEPSVKRFDEGILAASGDRTGAHGVSHE